MSQPCSHSKRMNGRHQQVMTFSAAPCSPAVTPKRPFRTVTMKLMKKEQPQRVLVVYRVLLSIKHLERKWINNVHVFLKRRKPCYEWNHGCNFMSDWMDKSLISKDSVVISQVALVSVLPYSREIPVTSSGCVHRVLNTKWHTHWHTRSRLHGTCFICEI